MYELACKLEFNVDLKTETNLILAVEKLTQAI